GIRDRTVTGVQTCALPIFFRNCPSGVGRGGGIDMDEKEFKKLLLTGADWALQNGFADEQDVQRTEEQGRLQGADPGKVSQAARRSEERRVGKVRRTE